MNPKNQHQYTTPLIGLTDVEVRATLTDLTAYAFRIAYAVRITAYAILTVYSVYTDFPPSPSTINKGFC